MFDKISNRMQQLLDMNNIRGCDVAQVTRLVAMGVVSGMSTWEIDLLAARISMSLGSISPLFAALGGFIEISNLHKNTISPFSKNISKLYEGGFINDTLYNDVRLHAVELDAMVRSKRDYDLDFFAFKTLEKTYLLQNDQAMERPQHLFMREAVALHRSDLANILETYELLSKRIYTHATPTMFNAGTPWGYYSSCFLLKMESDSIPGIYNTLSKCASISKSAGGIGLSVSNIRAKGTEIRGSNCHSNGIVPMLRVFEATARYVDQGGGKRKGSFAIYIEPWHLDIEDFLELRKPTGKEEFRARDLFYGLWVPDLFMKRVENNQDWTLFCPHHAPGLELVHGAEFDALYTSYEARKEIPHKVIKAQHLFLSICIAILETGMPYILFKDACNAKSNQSNLGTIQSSNLCAEIIQHTDEKQIAVCNLASINLSAMVVGGCFNFEKLIRVVSVAIRNLNKVIDTTLYPHKDAQETNERNRPLGLGVSGLADTFILMNFPFDSTEASVLNKQIFETMYYSAVLTSMNLAKEHGKPYSTYAGSPMSKGIFQFDMWGVVPTMYDWVGLKKLVSEHGVYNSLLLAVMPTASTSCIAGVNECIEPYASNIFNKNVLSGDHVVINKHLQHKLIELKLWNNELKEKIIAHRGSVQFIQEIPLHVRNLFKTAYEIKQKVLVQMSADRGPFICQSQSLNIFMANPDTTKVASLLFYGWKLGLKTGLYYLRTQLKVDAIQFTVDPQISKRAKMEKEEEEKMCKLNAGCLSCSS